MSKLRLPPELLGESQAAAQPPPPQPLGPEELPPLVEQMMESQPVQNAPEPRPVAGDSASQPTAQKSEPPAAHADSPRAQRGGFLGAALGAGVLALTVIIALGLRGTTAYPGGQNVSRTPEPTRAPDPAPRYFR